MRVRIEHAEDRRNIRLKLYKDDVFLIAHETIKKQAITLSIEELFASADHLANYLLENDLSERDIMQYDISELREEISDEPTFYVLLTLTFVKLCALRKVRPNAEAVARALVGFCQEYDDFTDLLGKFSKKEHERWLENKRVDLFAYELKCIGQDTPAADGQAVVARIVDAALGLSVEGMQHVENVLSEASDHLGHIFQSDLDRLRQARKMKSVANINIEKQNNQGCQQFMGKMENVNFLPPSEK